MNIHTTTPYKVKPGMLVLKRISDGHYYGVVSEVEVITDHRDPWMRTYRFTFEDGEQIVRNGSGAIYYKAG